MKTRLLKIFLLTTLIMGNANISYAKSNAKLPFLGTRYFNFVGGSGTGESITIRKDGQAIFKFIGTVSSEVTYKGKYQTIMTTDKGESYLKITASTIEMLDKNKQPIFECDENGTNYGADYTERCIQKLYLGE